MNNINNDTWINNLLTWADDNNVPRDIIPSDSKKLLSMTSFSLGDFENKDKNLSSIKFLPNEIGYLDNLESILLYDLNIRYLPYTLTKLNKLESLFIQKTKLNNIDLIGDLKQLKELVLYDMDLENLPSSIGSLENLTTLRIHNFNNLKSIPESICDLKNLKRLEITSCTITSLPDNIGNLTNTTIKLAFLKKLSYLPDSIIHVKDLILIDIPSLNLKNTVQENLNIDDNKMLTINNKYTPEQKNANAFIFLFIISIPIIAVIIGSLI